MLAPPMQPISATTTIAKPREEVFEYLVDIANHPEFLDHFMEDWRLTRVDSCGRGAGARFRVDAPRRRFAWADVTFVEVDPPRRIVALGRGGKFNRMGTYMEWTLEPAAGGTRVSVSFETEPEMLSDRIFDPLGPRSWFRRKLSKGVRRLRAILEEDAAPPTRGARATVAGL
jgi:uncharacterized protein YndB with AHSA1/START domain